MDPEKPQLPSEEEIAKLSRKAQIAYAARCAMRVFPLIGSEGHFDFWETLPDSDVHSIYAAILAAMTDSKFVDEAANRAAAAARKSNLLKLNIFVGVANAASRAALACSRRVDSVNAAARAADAALIVSRDGGWDNAAVIEASISDIELLMEIDEGKSIPWRYYKRRLFNNPRSSVEDWITDDIKSAFISSDCLQLLDWWIGFFEGKLPSKSTLTKWLEDWSNREQANASGNIDHSKLHDDDAKQHLAYQATNAADGAARVDFLNRSELIDSLAGMLAQENQQTPLTIGLFGHWGAGKSSVMQMLQEKLTDPEYLKSQEFLFSWFNCWEYEHTENIQAGLAQEVVEGLMGDGKFHDAERKFIKPMGTWSRICTRIEFLWIEKKWETIFWFGKTVATLAAIIAGGFFALESSDTPIFQTGITGVALLYFYNLSKQGKLLWDHPLKTELATFFKLPSYRKELGQIPQIRQQLESLCEVRLWGRGKARRRLVVFVDDMDRCKPETIAQAFDAIRLIVDIRQVIVIVGIDERVAFKAMGEAYKDYADPSSNRTKEDVARDYLGKIIQVPIRLNPPSAKDLKPYVEDKLFKDQAEVPTEDLGTDKPENSNEDHETPIQAEAQGPEASKKQEGNDIGEASNIESTSESSKNVGPKRRANLEETSEEVEMKETTEEVVAFYDLVRLFEFGNPRQLLRLRNSYRMLKGIDPETNQKLIDDRSLMIMLFWSEFRLEKPSDKVKQWIENSEIWLSEVVESIQKDESRESEAVMKFQKEFHPLIHEKQEGTGESEFYFENTALFELEAFTKTCILPYPKKEQVKRSNGT